MTRSKTRAVVHTARIARVDVDDLLATLEHTADVVHLSRTCACERRTLRGVPASQIDVLIDQRILYGDTSPHAERDIPVVEIARKRGRYDSAERWRVAVRMMHAAQAVERQWGRLDVETDADTIRLSLTTTGGVIWDEAFARLRSDLDGYDLPRIVAWHWTRYYQTCVSHEDALALASAVGTWLPDGAPTLSEANRAASRALYRLARDGGYRKLTLRERRKLGLDDDCGQWISEEVYARRQTMTGNPSGVGEWTTRAAHGGMR